MSLVALPNAIWVSEFYHHEKGALMVFFGSMLLFLIGWILTRIVSG